ncbi:MAG: hypothetical protein HXY51_04910 [Nitrospirae bacterium]|nr:hypothetical protein [Nitrospirota bacterium]
MLIRWLHLASCLLTVLPTQSMALERPPHDCRELAKQSEVVAVIKITRVTSETTVGTVDTYSHTAQATVVTLVKGKIERTFPVYAGQIDSTDPNRLFFIHYGHVNTVREGIILAFLARDGARWVGAHPVDSFQEILGGKVLDRGHQVDAMPLIAELQSLFPETKR